MAMPDGQELPPSNKRMTVKSVEVIEIEDGKPEESDLFLFDISAVQARFAPSSCLSGGPVGLESTTYGSVSVVAVLLGGGPARLGVGDSM